MRSRAGSSLDGIRARTGYRTCGYTTFRHTVVSLLLQLKTPPHAAQRIARHADVDLTLGIYAHTDLEAMREALDSIGWEDL